MPRRLFDWAAADRDPVSPLDDVLAITRSKAALIAGGNGARAAHRKTIQEVLKFDRLDWVFGEIGQAAPYAKLARGMHPGKYDLVFFLSAFAGHSTACKFIQACRAIGVPVIYITRGYGVNQFIDAIRKQGIPRKLGAV